MPTVKTVQQVPLALRVRKVKRVLPDPPARLAKTVLTAHLDRSDQWVLPDRPVRMVPPVQWVKLDR